MRYVVPSGLPRSLDGVKGGPRRIDVSLPSIARWNVSATIRAPTPCRRPLWSSASRRM